MMLKHVVCYSACCIQGLHLIPEMHNLRADAYTAKKKAGQEPQPDDLVKEVRSFGRSTVPDAVKAELLAELRDFIA